MRVDRNVHCSRSSISYPWHWHPWWSPEKAKYYFWHENKITAHQLENDLVTLHPNNFSSIEYFLSKFKTLRLLLEGCKVEKEEGSLIYSILANLGPAYYIFVSTFHSTREPIISSGIAYNYPSFDAFCNSLIREQEKILHLGLITSRNASKKALAAQQQSYQKNPKKQYPKKVLFETKQGS